MNDEKIITNLDNYRDAGHYSPKVCSVLVNKMHRGENMITVENYMDVLDEMKQLIENYDYEQIFKSE